MEIQKGESHRDLILPVTLILIAAFLATSLSFDGKSAITGAVTGITGQQISAIPGTPTKFPGNANNCNYLEGDFPVFVGNHPGKNGNDYCKSKGYINAKFVIIDEDINLLDSANGSCAGKSQLNEPGKNFVFGNISLNSPSNPSTYGSYCSTVVSSFAAEPTLGDVVGSYTPSGVYCCKL